MRVEHSIVDLSAIPRRQSKTEADEIMWGSLYCSVESDDLIQLQEISKARTNSSQRLHYISAIRVTREV